MTDPAPHDLRPPIDARSLVAHGAVRGAIGGFCWSLLVGVPLAFLVWTMPMGGSFWGLFTLGMTSLIWTAIAAGAGAGQTREKTFTDEQRAVLRKRTRRSAHQGACFALPVGLYALFGTWQYGAIQAIFGSAMIVGIWAGCAALVGHGLGKRTVAAMQREARAKAERVDAGMMPREAVQAAPSENLQPDVTRLAEARKRIDVGHED